MGTQDHQSGARRRGVHAGTGRRIGAMSDQAALCVKMQKALLSLCDYSLSWSRPFRDKGWIVTAVDIGHPAGFSVKDGILCVGLNLLDESSVVFRNVVMLPIYHAILAAPPCTCFCRPSSRWWGRQDSDGSTGRDVALLRMCLGVCKRATDWWALENPPGRHRKLIPELGAPGWQFHPFEYGEPWAKQTYIWGTARKPEPSNIVNPPPTRRTPNGKTQGTIAFMSSSWKRQREKTPAGFARAFAEVNAL